jgi:hypothetical protein
MDREAVGWRSERQMEPGELARRAGGPSPGGCWSCSATSWWRLPGGSGALGGVAAGQSDVDLVAVCAAAPGDELRRAIVDGLGELAMGWPVRGLEFVLYTRAAVAAPAERPGFELNLDVGPRMPYHLSLDPAAEPAHWFVLDLAILRDHGRPLAGPPARDLIGPIPRRRLLEALRDSLAWHGAHEPALQQSVLNASRGWRFAEEGVWSSKDDAGAWAMARPATRRRSRRPWPPATGTAPPTSTRPGSGPSWARPSRRWSGPWSCSRTRVEDGPGPPAPGG